VRVGRGILGMYCILLICSRLWAKTHEVWKIQTAGDTFLKALLRRVLSLIVHKSIGLVYGLVLYCMRVLYNPCSSFIRLQMARAKQLVIAEDTYVTFFEVCEAPDLCPRVTQEPRHEPLLQMGLTMVLVRWAALLVK
jgi:hypothetical protein